MKTIEINLYSFDELNEKAKQRAKDKYYEFEDYPFLSADLTESCVCLLEEAGVEFKDIKLYFSLSYCQGDGLCFIGTISKNGNTLRLTHNYQYYFAKSVNMEFTNEEGEDIEDCKDLKDIYFDVCAKLEKEGYGILEYRMDDKEFSEHCEANEYFFEADGTMYNG